MRITMTRTLVALMFGIVLSVGIEFPTVAEVVVGDGVKILEQKYHTPLTKDALVAALRDNLPVVRGAAAARLAFSKEKDTVPSILAALAIESSPSIKILFASSAAELGAQEGFAALRGMCRDSGWSSIDRMQAANMMIGLENEDCLADVLNVLRSHDNNDAVNDAANMAISILLQHQHIPAEELPAIRGLAQVFLRSENHAIRAGASDLLEKYGDSLSAEHLRGALAVEQDEAVRKAMVAALRALETKPVASPGEEK
jgi:HEAT repeat protein